MSDPAAALHRVREQLLDLSPRNRLLDTTRHRHHGSGIEIVEGRSDQVFQTLVRERRSMALAPTPQTPVENRADSAPPHGVPRLPTGLTSERLQSSLLRLHRDARTIYEERGIATLYLALGALEWYDPQGSGQPRLAPLILIPVRLERQDPTSPFELAWAGEEIVANIYLAHKLEQEFALELPGLGEPDALDPATHLQACAEAVSGAPRFKVHRDDMALGLFSFARLLVYRDLDPARWPASSPLQDRPLIRALLGAGFRDEPEGLPDDADLDHLLGPLETTHVLDADGAQSLAIEEVRRGRNLVIQGPPGTGKSQTIANAIAGAVRDGKKVLFVAEKMAALEVVRRRLDRLDLAPMCLALHDRRGGARELLDELRRTFELGRPRVEPAEPVARQLADLRRILNQHAEILHTPLEPSGLTPFALIGHLIRLVRRGTRRAEVRLPSAPAWTQAEIGERYGQMKSLIACLGRVGVPARHVWRGARLSEVPADPGRIEEQTRRLARSLKGLIQAIGALNVSLSVDLGRNPGEVARLLDTCEYLTEAPQPIDAAALDADCWRTERQDIARLVAAGMTREANQDLLRRHFQPIAWSTDVSDLRRRLADHRRFRLPAARPDYWRARADLQRLARARLPRSLEAQIKLLDRLREAQDARREIEHLRQIGARAFGRVWRGAESNWGHLASIEQWQREGDDSHLLPDAPRLLPRIADRERAGRLTSFAQQLLERVVVGCETLFALLELDLKEAFGHAELAAIPLDLLRDRLQAWSAHAGELTDWVAYQREASRAEEHGLGPLVERLSHGRLPVERAFDAFEAALFEPLLRHAMRRLPALAAFDGDAHERLIERFREVDRACIDHARIEVARAHYDRLTERSDAAATAGLGQELAERCLPIRALMAEAGGAVQAAKPVFMMSPLSVAEYLPPGALRFDLLVIDEAGQIEPVAALGAMARAEQLVVVGDGRQLPPKPLMSGPLTDRIEADDEPTQGADLESILDLCVTQGVPQRALRWHYRSRHPSLISFSNREFYGDGLCVVPSPFVDTAGLGLVFRHVPDGVYDRGGSRANRVEAQAVARAVLDHVRSQRHLSLGVGCFSTAQRDAIQHEMDRLRQVEPEVEAFLASGLPEPFFVKSLEHIQGDERDVILVSVGYGVDPSGYLAQGFAPLNADDGERRLNVLITRARRRLEVFSSIRSRDIDLLRPGRQGVAALKTFLQYAESGVLAPDQAAAGGFDSPFEEQLAAALAELGHQVESRIGVAGFFLDLAVRDPDRPDRYVLGIACDGASYRAAPTARERDRLRQQVLEDRGWIIHRVWSGDWFRRPAQELRRLTAAIEAARSVWQARDASAEESFPAQEPAPAAVPREPPATDERPAVPVAAPYIEADFSLPDSPEPHLVPIEQMVDALVRIVEIEGPIHKEEIARRFARVCGADDHDRRTVDAVTRGLARALRRRLISREGDFCAAAGLAEPPLRDRSGASASLRRPDMLPPAEIRAAALRLVRTQPGVTQVDAIVGIGRLLGFENASGELCATIDTVLERLLREGTLDRSEQGTLRARRRSAA